MTPSKPWQNLTPEAAELLCSQVAFPDSGEGLIAAIAQEASSGKILMIAWMNRAALTQTLISGRVCYWSRSRQKLWRKGDESGHIQRLVSLRLDCDRDALLLQVEQTGAACHTGRHNCFFYAPTAKGWEIESD
ncbi:MAG: phosphoribosyl-AMP cyclohydrolase [Candidatus Pacebacteria bacterium]|nr:phosphoribosyl-AMP cyclohydrolase [Candidatus Paceibacterota bacterium]